MPAFLIPAIAGALLSIASSLVGRVLVALGMGAIAYTGVNAALTYFSDRVVTSANSAGVIIAGMLGTLQPDVAPAIASRAKAAAVKIDTHTSS